MTSKPKTATSDDLSINQGQLLVDDPSQSHLGSDFGSDGALLTSALTSSGTSASTLTKVTRQAVSSTATQYLDYGNIAMRVPSSSAKKYWGGNGGQNLEGTKGSDVFTVYSNKDKVTETVAGVSTVNAQLYTPSAFTLSNNVKNIYVTGDKVNVVGNKLGNLMVDNGSGAVTLDGGAGNDVLVGGKGSDTFVEKIGSGHDVIYNFDPAKDLLRLNGFTSFTSVKSAMSQSGKDVVIRLNYKDSFTLRNTTIGKLSASDFQLGVNTAKLRRTFDDEFNSFTWSADGSKGWMTTYPREGISARSIPGNKSVEYDSDASVGVNPFSDSNGVLTITAAPAKLGVGTPAGSGLTYTSGQITTYKSFKQLYGYFVVRAQLPSVWGMWPGFWMKPADNSWPPELDIMEQLGKDPNTIYQTVHTNVGGPNQQIRLNTNTNYASTTFNDYGVDWEADYITYYINGTAVAKAATPSDMHKPMYMLLGLGAGGAGSWAGVADGKTSGQLKVDYVRAYAPTEIHKPITATDSYTRSGGKVLNVTADKGVLANDLDPNAQTLSAALAPNGGPAHGKLALNKNGSFTYTANVGFAGTDHFTYLAKDSLGVSAPTTVAVALQTQDPIVHSANYRDNTSHILSVSASNGVLSTATDRNGLKLTAALVAHGGVSHGKLNLAKDGSFVYTPTKGFVGFDHFTYAGNDGLATSIPATVTLRVADNALSTA